MVEILERIEKDIADSGNISGFETAENRVKRNAIHLIDPSCDANLRSNQKKEQV
jgi:hypothetical protein